MYMNAVIRIRRCSIVCLRPSSKYFCIAASAVLGAVMVTLWDVRFDVNFWAWTQSTIIHSINSLRFRIHNNTIFKELQSTQTTTMTKRGIPNCVPARSGGRTLQEHRWEFVFVRHFIKRFRTKLWWPVVVTVCCLLRDTSHVLFYALSFAVLADFCSLFSHWFVLAVAHGTRVAGPFRKRKDVVHHWKTWPVTAELNKPSALNVFRDSC